MSEPEVTPEDYGKMCWLEIPVYDAERAGKFYSGIFAWECSPEVMPMASENGVKSMHFFNSTDKKVCGTFLLMAEGYQMTKYGKLGKEVLPPLPTFCVKECDETLQKVKSLGGSTQCPKTAIGGEMGHYARFNDSEGNILGIWSKN